MKIIFLLSILLFVPPSWGKGKAPAGVLIENNAFSFRVPSDFKKTDAQGIDSLVEGYSNDNIQLEFDYGPYSNDFSDWPPETNYNDMNINGNQARIGTAHHDFGYNRPYSTQVHFAGKGLSMFAACAAEIDIELAKDIFKSIKFK